jgi:CheY-like chemotaxis protein
MSASTSAVVPVLLDGQQTRHADARTTGDEAVVIRAQRYHLGAEPAPRVVVAEADDDTRMLYREALRPLGVDVVDAADGRDALVQCLLQPPALVITDTWLPFVNGYDLCALLRRDSLTRGVPIIVVTADTRTAELVTLRQLGAISILSKPVLVDVLAEEVERIRGEPPPSAVQSAKRDVDGRPPMLHPPSATRSFHRFETTAPAMSPPALHCPDCDRPLQFRKSRIGGVTRRNAEQWDEFHCLECAGEFEYRHRTKLLRPIR